MKRLAGFVWFLVALLLAALTGCSYEDTPSSYVGYSHGCWDDTSTSLVFARQYKLYRRATGLNALPDGGQPVYLQDTLDLYVLDTDKNNVRWLAAAHGRPSGNPAQVRIAWRGGTIAYWVVSTRNRGQANAGVFLVDSATGEQRLIVQDGEMPELSPDGATMIYQRPVAGGTELRAITTTGEDDRLVTTVTDGKPVFTLWGATADEVRLYIRYTTGEFAAELLDVATGERTRTNLPYVRNYGNVRVTPYLQNFTVEDWGDNGP